MVGSAEPTEFCVIETDRIGVVRNDARSMGLPGAISRAEVHVKGATEFELWRHADIRPALVPSYPCVARTGIRGEGYAWQPGTEPGQQQIVIAAQAAAHAREEKAEPPHLPWT